MVICGVVIGVMQWLVLQRQVPLAGIWVLVVAISFLVSYALEKAVGLTSWYVFGLGTGLMTGLCLVLLLSASRSTITKVNVGSK